MNKLTREQAYKFDRQRSLAYINSVDTLTLYQDMSSGTAAYPGQGSPIGLSYVALKCASEAGELAGHVGKAMRDDGLIDVADRRALPYPLVTFKDLTAERKELIVHELGDILWYVAAAAREIGVGLSYVASQNLHKIAGRVERGTVQGSGDDR